MIIDRIKCLDVFYKKSVLKNLKNSKENTCTAIFLIKFSKKYRNFRVKGFGGVPFKVICKPLPCNVTKTEPQHRVGDKAAQFKIAFRKLRIEITIFLGNSA